MRPSVSMRLLRVKDLVVASTVTPAPLHPQRRSLVFGLYGGLAVLVTMGWTFMALVLSHCFILYSVGMLKSKWMCFASGLVTLASIKLEPYNSWQVREKKMMPRQRKKKKCCFFLKSTNSFTQESLVTGSFNLQDVLFYGGCGFSLMRCMSFALENCDRKEGSYTFTDLLKYNFYLPYFFFGPIMTFDRFHAQVRRL